MSEELTEYTTGWVDDQEAVTEVVQDLPWSNFGATDAGAVSFDEIPDHVYGWKEYEEIAGKPWPIFNQGNVGTCVSFGTSAAMLFTQISEIKRGDHEQPRTPSMEVIYAGSRVEVGGGRIRGDGSVGQQERFRSCASGGIEGGDGDFPAHGIGGGRRHADVA